MKGKLVYKFNGKNVTFFTEKNQLNNNQMFWFDTHPAMYVGNSKAKSIIKEIKNNFNIIENTII